MYIKIYQCRLESTEGLDRVFMDSKFVEHKYHGRFPKNIYKLVWEGECPAQNLEDVFEWGQNSRRMQTRPISVSDIIETEVGTYFCDMIGFTEIQWEGY